MRHRSTVVAFLVLAVILGACSSGSESGPGPSPTGSPSPTISGSPIPEPAIVVTSPAPGDQVSSPVRIQGDADVFEATVSIDILDSAGNRIVRTFTTATCGTGCRGTFSKAVRFTVDTTQPGTIQVYESSAQDGTPINVVDIPVTLVA
ncbi:MAG TPA: Gmad2 immunoglobulin-like domain-containing protein [Actinomycetota bacterium]|jgi:Immunoglobulin-like domain of bacterial spore germination|nr:Gmad2 immunoglobulin-like domain-containing protein [Actinomycetota bacterium]